MLTPSKREGYKMFRKLGAILCIGTLFAVPAVSQIATATSLVGNVLDSSGKSIPGARVTVVETGTGDTRTATTNDQGYYSVEFARVGVYSVTVEQAGFQKVTKTGIQVSV